MSQKGLAAYRKSKEKKTSTGRFYKPAANTKVRVRPLQELDSDSKNYSSKNGLATFTKEWQNPQDFTKVIVDTMEEEGACVGQELSNEFGWGDQDNKGWRPLERMYFNALVDNGTDEPFVTVLQFNIGGPRALGSTIIKFSDDKADHSITNRWWTYERVGAGQFDTVYTFTADDPSDDVDVEKYELADIDDLLPHIPYASQSAYLGAQGWIDRYGDEVKAVSNARRNKNKSGDSDKKTERTPTQNTEW